MKSLNDKQNLAFELKSNFIALIKGKFLHALKFYWSPPPPSSNKLNILGNLNNAALQKLFKIQFWLIVTALKVHITNLCVLMLFKLSKVCNFLNNYSTFL